MNSQDTETTSPGLWNWEIVRWVVTISLLLFALIFLYDGITEESNRLAIRWSARISGLLFCLAFVASGLQRLTRNVFTFWLRMNRKYLGISFAIIHLIHLGFLILLQVVFHPVFTLAPFKSLLGGGLAYLFVVLMLVTSFPAFTHRLSPRNWKLLHLAGAHWIWFIFFISYFKRALTDSWYIPFVMLLLVVLIIRWWPQTNGMVKYQQGVAD